MDERTVEGADPMSEELAQRLRELQEVVAPEEIAELWVFPPLPEVEASSEFLLFTRFDEGEARRLYSARVPPAPNGNGAGKGSPAGGPSGVPAGTSENGAGPHPREDGSQEVVEHGSVPASRVPRLVQGFLRRLDEDEEPLHLVIDGSPGRWSELVPVRGNGGDPGPAEA